MSDHALGVAVSPTSLRAVLVEQTDEGLEVRLRWSRGRDGSDAPDLPFGEPQDPISDPTSDPTEEPDDVTIEFGDSGGEGDDMFLESEFGELEDEGDDYGVPDDRIDTWNFRAAIDDLLESCMAEGFEDPRIGFCATAGDVHEVELRLPADEGTAPGEEGPTGLPLPASRSALLDLLEEQYEGSLEEERVGFVPMRETGDGRRRVLALVIPPDASVVTTLAEMQEKTIARSPRAELLDTEVPLYLGLARSALQLEPGSAEKTLLVRAGVEDTLVLFMEGNTLRQVEQLPELTVEDPAETICSRVLLLQDEYGVGDVQHILLLSEDDEEVLADAFRSYFASTKLQLLRSHLPGGEHRSSSLYLAATGVALRLLDTDTFGPSFHSVDLLPGRCRPSPFRLPVGWSVPFLLVLLAATTLGFVWLYVSNANAISDRRARLRALEQQIEGADPDALQRRIDSVQSTTAQYARGLDVVGRLLKGSNKWSRGLATLSEAVDEVGGLSLEQWSPVRDGAIAVQGRANSRDRVVELARTVNGEIGRLTFTDVRDVTLYSFDMAVPLDTTRPEAAQYWREQQTAGSGPDEAAEKGAAAQKNVTTEEEATAEGKTRQGAPTAAASPSAPPGSRAPSSASMPDTKTALPDTGWTIVVASFAERRRAETARQSLTRAADTLRHGVRLFKAPDSVWHRVGVGVFPTLEAAQSASRTMDKALPDDIWMHRFTKGTVATLSPDTSSATP